MRFVILSLLFLGWAFYELSGGSEFETGVTAEALPPPPAVDVAVTQVDPMAEIAAARLAAAAQESAPAIDIAVATVLAAETDTSDPAEGTDEEIVTQRSGGTFDDEGRPSVSLISLEDSSTFFAAPLTALPQPVDQGAPADIRTITGNRVNLRAGPGTGFSVIGSHQRGEEMLILEESDNDWLRLRPASGGGDEGWMAAFLLSEPLR